MNRDYAIVAQAGRIAGTVTKKTERRPYGVIDARPIRIGSYPDPAVGIFAHRQDDSQIYGFRTGFDGDIARNCSVRAIVIIHTTSVRPDPQISSAVLEQAGDVIVRERILIVRIVTVYRGGQSIVLDQAVECPEPQEADTVLGHAIDEIMRDALFEREMLEFDGGLTLKK